MGTLTDKTALITGATRSIGRGIAEGYLKEGARVAVTGRSAEKGKAFLDEVAAGPNAIFIEGDARKQDDIEGAVEETIGRFGKLDVMVINAGGPNACFLADLQDDDYHATVALNLHQFVWAMRASLRHMIPRGSGRIIALSSFEGKAGSAGMSIYSACKHGVHGLVKSVAKEVGMNGITVNGICPGIVVTDNASETGVALQHLLGFESFAELFDALTKGAALKRPIEIEECAALATFLASDGASGITGSLISVDGGISPY
jgi:3-hydroxybutyrate dehydrogenase/3-oxoacyl-[acyl-carrier protein] reductase